MSSAYGQRTVPPISPVEWEFFHQLYAKAQSYIAEHYPGLTLMDMRISFDERSLSLTLEAEDPSSHFPAIDLTLQSVVTRSMIS